MPARLRRALAAPCGTGASRLQHASAGKSPLLPKRSCVIIRYAMKLVVQIPALNEEKTIQKVIRAIPRDLPGIRSTESRGGG